MNFLKRALKNVLRRKTRSILLLITFFVIGNFVIIGLGIANASESAKTLTRQKMRAIVTYEVDNDAVWEYADSIEDEDELQKFYENYPTVKISEVSEMLQDSRVKAANSVSTDTAYRDDDSIDYIHLNNQAEEWNHGESCEVDSEGNEFCYTYEDASFLIKSNYFPDMIEFADGMWDIVDGRFYSEEEINNKAYVCLISEALADANGISVGDEISIYVSEKSMFNENGPMKDVDKSVGIMELEVIGIYNHNSPVTPNSENYDYLSPYENPDNVILMPATSYKDKELSFYQEYFKAYAKLYPDDEYYNDPENIPTVDDISGVSNATLLLNDPLEVDQFVEDYKDKVGEFKQLTVDNEEFERLSKPLDTLSMYAKFIVWLVVINAIVIITLVVALTLKTREYEIGVLLSIGASKGKVIAQFFCELALVAILGFSLAIVSGSMVANKVGRTVLDYQIVSSGVEDEEDDFYYYESIWDDNYNTQITLDDLVEEYDVSISPKIIAEIYVVGLGIVLISTIIPSMMIMRFNPKKILMNQN